MTAVDLGGPVGLPPTSATLAAASTSTSTNKSMAADRLSPPAPDADSNYDDQSSQGSSISLHPPPLASSRQPSATEVLRISTPRLKQNDLTPPSSNTSLAPIDDGNSADAAAKDATSAETASAAGATQATARDDDDDAAALRPRSQSPISSCSHEGLAGRKRTAAGDLKVVPPACHQPPLSLPPQAERGHVRSNSTLSNGSNSNVTEICAQLRTKLKYAMIKVQNGWQTRSLDELESIATESPRSTTSGFQHLPDRPSFFTSPQVRDNRFLHRKWSDSSSSESVPSDPRASTPNAHFRPTNSVNTRSLAPPVDIKPGARRRPAPNDGLALLGLTASPSHSHGLSPAVRPSTSQRTPSQNAAMEADAVETLLFMASPKNSGYHPSAQSLQESSLRSTLSSQTSPPVRTTKLSQTSAFSPKRVAFQDHSAPPLFKTREAQIDHLLDNMPDDSDDDDLDSIPVPPANPRQASYTPLS